MDWLREEPFITAEDTNIFKFRCGSGVALEISRGENTSWCSRDQKLVSDSDWDSWLDTVEASGFHTRTDGICLILLERAESKWFDSMLASQLPFSREIFDKITKKLFVHSSIARVINRNTVPHCSCQFNAWGPDAPGAIAYNCRSSAAWPDDMALSATYFPDRRFTYAVVYGCPSHAVATIKSRLLDCRLNTFHPLTLPTILSDIERYRHVDMVNTYVSKLVQRVLDMGNPTQVSKSTSQSSNSELEKQLTEDSKRAADDGSVMEWLEMSHIRNELIDWQAQLRNLVQHVNDLERFRYEETIGPIAEGVFISMRDQGVRIKERLIQIINEYDAKARECSTIIDGMSFATQTEWNKIARADTKTNLKISKSTMDISRATQRDGNHMRSIALLTMTFLPGTFVATLFSMSFFDWKQQNNSMMSPYIWIYAAVTVILTVVTFAVWYYCTGNKSLIKKKNILPL
ncbi:uncharacterized protein F4822DRAFT_43973 [Hypoxylon trugodes]|uniref:uncharacterized protein n=1 Tax=Hypoxylon trugodes TaxID=326681 RepID=UPI00219055DF|nr:uncharacterized protein F4822DRAFT_43973 [Hypoxylon trugodes]KAI1394283.1 hypothetical protein F4822DRAFT_43973 [Hypoxylon trugodes]